jgi:hypothetical protein
MIRFSGFQKSLKGLHPSRELFILRRLWLVSSLKRVAGLCMVDPAGLGAMAIENPEGSGSDDRRSSGIEELSRLMLEGWTMRMYWNYLPGV